MKPSWQEIEKAQQFLRSYFAPTRLIPAPTLCKSESAPVFLKLESELPTGSFKVRGALYALKSEVNRRNISEVVASSTGNHGAAVAYAARLLNVPAAIFLPNRANPKKRRRIEELGAKIIEQGKDISAAWESANEYAARTGAFFLNDATDPRVPAGTATIGLEILAQLPEVAAIWVPMGDTALVRGIAAGAKHLRHSVRIVGVQSERAAAYALSWKQGLPLNTETCDTIADGLATRTTVPENVSAIRELVDDVRLVSEAQLLRAIRHLGREEHIVAEPAAAATTAAWLNERDSAPSGPTVLLVTGCNISEEVFQRAMLADGETECRA